MNHLFPASVIVDTPDGPRTLQVGYDAAGLPYACDDHYIVFLEATDTGFQLTHRGYVS